MIVGERKCSKNLDIDHHGVGKIEESVEGQVCQVEVVILIISTPKKCFYFLLFLFQYYQYMVIEFVTS